MHELTTDGRGRRLCRRGNTPFLSTDRDRMQVRSTLLRASASWKQKGPVIPFRFTDNSAQMLVHDVICIIWWPLSRGEKAEPESQGCLNSCWLHEKSRP